MTFRLPHKRRAKRRLALTPLIDVVFLLLVFFILAGRFEQHNHLTLAQSSAGQAAEEATPPQMLRLMLDGAVQIEGRTLSVEEAQSHLVSAGRPPVILAPRADVDVQVLVTWVDHLRDIGIQQVSFLGTVAP
ncbi:MAG: biopolymer transporter ExbD [Pseudomonadota bacterium]